MIDYNNAIFSAVAPKAREAFEGLKTTSELSDEPPEMPCLQMEETRNLPVEWDNSPTSTFAQIQIRVRVWTNNEVNRKQKAREIMAFVDSVLEPLNFRRTSYVPQNGLYNNSAYRIEANYEAVIREDGLIYRT